VVLLALALALSLALSLRRQNAVINKGSLPLELHKGCQGDGGKHARAMHRGERQMADTGLEGGVVNGGVDKKQGEVSGRSAEELRC
jgi:hypothetical protein